MIRCTPGANARPNSRRGARGAAVLCLRAGRGVLFRVAKGCAGAGAWDDADPIFVGEGDIDAARALVAEADQAELFLYPGNQHYFADSSLPSYDAEASALLIQRVLEFLAAR